MSRIIIIGIIPQEIHCVVYLYLLHTEEWGCAVRSHKLIQARIISRSDRYARFMRVMRVTF